jgi:hypothetical protein
MIFKNAIMPPPSNSIGAIINNLTAPAANMLGFATPKIPGAAFMYETILPYLSSMPVLSSLAISSSMQRGINDFRPLPSEDDSFINCVLEAVRHIGRSAGLDHDKSDDLLLLVKLGFMRFVKADLSDARRLTSVEIDAVRIAVRSLTSSARFNTGDSSEYSNTPFLQEALTCAQEVNSMLDAFDTRRRLTVPRFDVVEDVRVHGIARWEWLDRLHRVDVEDLAGDASPPKILRPVELSLVPDRVSDFASLAAAMHHTLNACLLLANQSDSIRNSYTLRMCLIEHLFVRVIPLPLPLNHPKRNSRCFWHAQPIRYETQMNILRLLNLICRHFATASLSLQVTASTDAIRILVFACMAAVCDAGVRKVATDTPSQSSLHYSGKAPGPVTPFGFYMGIFAEESDYLQLLTPEATAVRTQVLDYFYNMKKVIKEDHLLFNFEKSRAFGTGDSEFIDQLCIQMGFDRTEALQYMTGENSELLDHYPELGFFRDLIFMFKLVTDPSATALPDQLLWDVKDSALRWSSSNNSYKIYGFCKDLECTVVSEPVDRNEVKTRTLISRFLR